MSSDDSRRQTKTIFTLREIVDEKTDYVENEAFLKDCINDINIKKRSFFLLASLLLKHKDPKDDGRLLALIRL